MEQNILIGKTITGLKIAADKMALLFEVAGGDPVRVLVDADCCSYSWIEHIELPALGFPATVSAVEDLYLDGPYTGNPTIDGDVIAYYGCKITTDRGELLIDFRNDSNGYYGGNLSWPEDGYFYGSVYGQNNSKEEWRAVRAPK